MIVWLQRVRDYLVKKRKRSRDYSQKIDAMASSDHLCGKKDCFCVSRYACVICIFIIIVSMFAFMSENYEIKMFIAKFESIKQYTSNFKRS